MKKIKLLGLLSLFVIPILGNVSFTNVSKYESNLATTELKDSNKDSLVDPNPVMEDCFRVNGTLYDTFADAINGATDGDTIQVLKDFTASDTPETADDLPLVTINKSLTINGIGDDGAPHQIIGQKIDINGNITVNFDDVIINGNKKWNQNGSNNNYYLIDCNNGAVLNLNKHTVIKNYKFYGHSVIRLNANATLNINDETEITDCAAKFGIIRFNPSSNCPAVYMNGGKIHHNYSSNRGIDIDSFVEGLVFYVMGNKDATNPTKLYISGGEICYNSAACWDEDSDKKCHSVGLIFLHSGFVDIKILGGSIHDNVAKLGGAMCFGYLSSKGHDYKPSGNVEIGGNAYIYDNHGVDDNNVQFNSNIYFDRPDASNKNVVVSTDYPLTKNSKIGILFSDSDLPEPGLSRTAVHNASLKDLSHFVADNQDYTTIYEGDLEHSIAIYQYTPEDPRFTPPIIVDRDNLAYTGEPQCLIATPGSVVEGRGGTLMYSTDYNGDISTAHWTSDINEVTGTNVADYNVTYYVTANPDDGTRASTPITIITNIKPQEVIDNPFTVDQPTFSYDGNEHIPTISNDKGLIEGVDYEVTYPEDKVNVGTKTVTITLIGNYSSEQPFTLTYAITPLVVDISKITWPTDTFVHKEGVAQSITPTITSVDGKEIKLGVKVYIEGDRSKEVEFKDPTKAPDKRYEVVAYSNDPNYQIPETAIKYYTMRVPKEEFEENMEIETLPGSDKPIVKVESETGFDSWTKLVAKSVDKNEEKEQYQETTEDLSKSKNLAGDDAVSAVYDVKLLKDNIEIQPDGTLKIHFALPNGINVNNNISIYHIHVNEDGSKEIAEIKHDYTEDGYATIITDKLSSFVIVHHQKSLLWLIITLSVVGAALIGAYAFVIVKEKQKKAKEGANNE